MQSALLELEYYEDDDYLVVCLSTISILCFQKINIFEHEQNLAKTNLLLNSIHCSCPLTRYKVNKQLMNYYMFGHLDQ